jgi:hypothetical protein
MTKITFWDCVASVLVLFFGYIVFIFAWAIFG